MPSDPDKVTHFFLTQAQVLMVAALVIGLMQLSSHIAIYIAYCTPILILYMLIYYGKYWEPREDLTRQFNGINCILFFVGCPVFFAIYFAIFDITASLEFEKVDNCQVIGTFSTSIGYEEQYQILQVDFDYNGNRYLGYACSSNHYIYAMKSGVPPFKFIEKGDDVPCGQEQDDGDDDRRILQSRQRRQLAVGGRGIGGSVGGGSGSGGSSRSIFSSRSSSFSKGCTTSYKFSKVKLPSWVCMKRKLDFEEYMQKQICYVNFYKGGNAEENGKNRLNPKDESHFPIIMYQSEPFYPKTALVFLILLSFFPFILSFNGIFQYTSNKILKITPISKNNFMKEYNKHRAQLQQVAPEQTINKEDNNIREENNNLNKDNNINIEHNNQNNMHYTNNSPSTVPMVFNHYNQEMQHFNNNTGNQNNLQNNGVIPMNFQDKQNEMNNYPNRNPNSQNYSNNYMQYQQNYSYQNNNNNFYQNNHNQFNYQSQTNYEQNQPQYNPPYNQGQNYEQQQNRIPNNYGQQINPSFNDNNNQYLENPMNFNQNNEKYQNTPYNYQSEQGEDRRVKQNHQERQEGKGQEINNQTPQQNNNQSSSKYNSQNNLENQPQRKNQNFMNSENQQNNNN